MRMPRHTIQLTNHALGLNRPGHHPIPTGLFSAAAGLWRAAGPAKTPKPGAGDNPGGNGTSGWAGDRT